MAEPFTLHRGASPLVLSLPHVGTLIPDDLQPPYTPRALALEDTDWHLDRLYAFAADLGATVLSSVVSRYVIDLNRPPDDVSLYPGANTTGLCPLHFFTGDALYRPGCEPAAAEIVRRREYYWQPYHTTLEVELNRVRTTHGYAILLDGHSIRSEIAWLFPGRLPDFSLGTAAGASCHLELGDDVHRLLRSHSRFSTVRDQRFQGGYITRHYGRPAEQIHALQLEMCQCLYMSEVLPFAYDTAAAARVQPVLVSLIELLHTTRPVVTPTGHVKSTRSERSHADAHGG
jgi:N-formylglutamate deformylase